MRSTVVPIALVFIAGIGRAESAGTWFPPDPNNEVTTVEFTTKWAKLLRGFHTLADLQRAAGSGGKIIGRSLHDNDPTVSYHWQSEPPNSGEIGYMLATLRPDGRVGVDVLTLDDVEFVINNNGTFVCDKCKPPIDIER